MFEDDETLISKNSTLIIVRKPLPRKQQKVWEEEEKISAASLVSASAGAGVLGPVVRPTLPASLASDWSRQIT